MFFRIVPIYTTPTTYLTGTLDTDRIKQYEIVQKNDKYIFGTECLCCLSESLEIVRGSNCIALFNSTRSYFTDGTNVNGTVTEFSVVLLDT